MQPKVSDIQSISIDLEIAQLLQKGVIQPCYHEAGEYFCFLNLKSLNTHVTNHHFKIDNIWTAIGTMKPGCYMASIDLKDAYYSVAISSTDQKFLQFEWKGTLYQFACFPIGVALCPRKFTKLLKLVFFLFQAKRPHFSALYRWFLVNRWQFPPMHTECYRYCHSTWQSWIHYSSWKVGLSPNSVFLAFVLNSVLMQVSLTQEQALTLKEACENLLATTSPVLGRLPRY